MHAFLRGVVDGGGRCVRRVGVARAASRACGRVRGVYCFGLADIATSAGPARTRRVVALDVWTIVLTSSSARTRSIIQLKRSSSCA